MSTPQNWEDPPRLLIYVELAQTQLKEEIRYQQQHTHPPFKSIFEKETPLSLYGSLIQKIAEEHTPADTDTLRQLAGQQNFALMQIEIEEPPKRPTAAQILQMACTAYLMEEMEKVLDTLLEEIQEEEREAQAHP